MNIKVFQNRKIEKCYFYNEGTQNENDSSILTFDVPQEYEDYIKRIVFITEDGNFWDYINENKYILKNNITKYGILSAYIWLTKDTKDFRTEEFELNFYDNKNPDDVIPSEEQVDGFATMIEILEEKISEVELIKIDIGDFKQALDDKVDKKEGYDLSQNDFTNELKDKLDKLNAQDDKVVNGHYDEENKQIILELQSGQEVRIPVNDLLDDFYVKSKVDELLKQKQDQIDELKAENEQQQEQINYLDKTLTRAEASGEYIHTKDSANYPFSDFNFDTNIKQDSREGYQELNLPDYTETKNGVTLSIKNGEVSMSGTPTAVTSFYIPITDINLKTTDTFSVALNDNKTVPSGFGRYLTDIDKNLIKWSYGMAGFQDKTGFSPTTDVVAKYFHLALNTVNVDYTGFKFKPMFEKGNVSHEFEQYGSMPSIEFPSEIKTPVGKQSLVSANENLWNYKEDAYISNNDGSATITDFCMMSDFIPIPNDATFVYFYGSNLSSSMENVFANRVGFYDANKKWLGNQMKNVISKISIYAGAKYIKASFPKNIENPMIAFSEIAYTPHQSQVQDIDLTSELLGPIVEKEDGDYFENRYLKTRLTSNMSWALSGNNYWYRVIISELSKKIESTIFSTHFKGTDNNGNKTNYAKSYGNSYICLGTGGNGLVGISATTFESLDTLKTFLDENEVYIVGELATPTYTKLTDEQQAQWNKIKKMHTYEGVTNIYTINDNGISPVINMKYVKSPKVVEENLQAQIDKINSAIVSLGANV